MARQKFSEPMRRKVISLPDRMWDDIRRLRHDDEIDTESEAVRVYLQEAIDAKKAGKRKRNA